MVARGGGRQGPRSTPKPWLLREWSLWDRTESIGTLISLLPSQALSLAFSSAFLIPSFRLPSSLFSVVPRKFCFQSLLQVLK